MPDLENRAPSLGNWVGRDLDTPIRALLESRRAFYGRISDDLELAIVTTRGRLHQS